MEDSTITCVNHLSRGAGKDCSCILKDWQVLKPNTKKKEPS